MKRMTFDCLFAFSSPQKCTFLANKLLTAWENGDTEIETNFQLVQREEKNYFYCHLEGGKMTNRDSTKLDLSG